MSKQLDILFLGRLFPPVNASLVRGKMKADMQDAANVLQWNIIEGLIKNECGHISVVSYLPVDSWPKHYSDAFLKRESFELDKSLHYTHVGFCNVTKIKQLTNRKCCNSEVVKWAKDKSDRKKVIICYSCNNTLMRAVAAAKEAAPDILAIQVIADITQFASNNVSNLVRRLHTQREISVNKKLERYIDKYVLLTKQMKDKLQIQKEYIVMEGIVPETGQHCEQGVPVEEGQRTILYTGSLNTKYGIIELLNAFDLIKDDTYRLIICGLGNGEQEITERMQRDFRIVFKGKIKHDEALRLQKNATVLVNPRQNKEEFTKYSFPSKTLEYLVSGVPVVAYKLDGIPDEYDDYIFYVPDNSPETLAQTLISVCEIPLEERQLHGSRAKKFVFDNKNNVAQAKKILSLIR